MKNKMKKIVKMHKKETVYTPFYTYGEKIADCRMDLRDYFNDGLVWKHGGIFDKKGEAVKYIKNMSKYSDSVWHSAQEKRVVKVTTITEETLEVVSTSKEVKGK